MGLSFYYTPTRVTFGPGAENNAGSELKKEGAAKVLIHYGSQRIVKNGLLENITHQLDENGISYMTLGGVVPNPRLSLVREGIRMVKENGIDFILAVGGGSVIDSAKCIGYGSVYDGDVWDFYSQKAVPQKTLPVGCILTMAAAGSEMSDSSVITNEEGGLKRGCNSDVCRLRFALLNPLPSALRPSQSSDDLLSSAVPDELCSCRHNDAHNGKILHIRCLSTAYGQSGILTPQQREGCRIQSA